MRRYKFILLLFAASLIFGCQKLDSEIEDRDNNTLNGNVEVLEDGRIKVTTYLKHLGMTSINTRANSYEDNIYNGWCLVFGRTDGGNNIVKDDGNYGYGDDSPLIQVVPITANANGTFFMTFTPFAEKAYMRIVVNLTDRENKTLESVVSWQDIADGVGGDASKSPSHSDVVKYRDDSNYNLATFGQYRHQSVGLDGIYNIDYKTTVTPVYLAEAKEDYSGTFVNWTVNYQNTETGFTSGVNYITGDAETYNGNVPDPMTQLNTTTGLPMSSYGWVLTNISDETLDAYFGTSIDMIRVCSKVVVDASASDFDMQEVYVIDAAQEARIRSTVMSNVTDGGESGTTTTSSTFSLPVDLGGTITYGAMKVDEEDAKVSDPIYFYPNSGGGDYVYSDVVNNKINPQYIIIKGQANGYDTPGYYKVALKAQYPLVREPGSDKTNTDEWSPLTYDILRNTSFTVNISDIDKPGYKTFDDAADPNSPANNISYSITIEADDNRYEILVSKGTYYAELETSRVYVKGYMDEGITGCYLDFNLTPSTDNTVPTVYVQTSDYDEDVETTNVELTHCLVLREGDNGYSNDDWSQATKVETSINNTGDGLSNYLVKIDGSKFKTKVRVYYDVSNSGRIRLRIGDILKFIPVTYDRFPISYKGTNGVSVIVTGTYETVWDNFAYEDVEYDVSHNNYIEDFELEPDGSVDYDNSSRDDFKPELRARIYPANAGDGIAVLYLRQASDFNIPGFIAEGETGGDPTTTNIIEYAPQGKVYNAEAIEALIGTDVEIADNDISGAMAGGEKVTIKTSSVDGLTISQTTNSTTVTDQPNYINATNATDGTSVTFYTNSFDYDVNTPVTDFSTIMTEPSTSTTTITLTNAAGDTKTYMVNQIHYPPIYMVTNNYGTSKTYAMSYWWFRSITEDGCVIYAVNLYNYDNLDAQYSCVTSLATSGNNASEMDQHLYPTFFNSSFISSYLYTNGDVSGVDITSGRNNNGDTVNYSSGEVHEFNMQGGNINADAAIGVIRNYDDVYGGTVTNPGFSATAKLTITIKDKYGETYTTTKDFSGI